MAWFSTSSGKIELRIGVELARSGSHPGPCDDDIAYIARLPHIARQLAKIDPDTLRDDLEEYGAWDREKGELDDHDQNLQRILWLACGDIVEDAFQRENRS